MGKYILPDNTHTNIDGRDYGPGDEVELSDEQGKRLHEQGILDTPESARKAQAAGDEQSQAEQDAEKAAADLEANKVRTAEVNRSGQSTAADHEVRTPRATKK